MVSKYEYKVITVGGTFDYLHKGHRAILRQAFKLGERVVVGVASDRMVREARISGGEERRRWVERYLRNEGVLGRAEIVKINDMFGPLKEETGIEAMVVTRETRGNAERINKWRRENGLSVLDIVEVGMELAQDGEPISSRRIRAGEIDREGKVFGRHKLWGKLPESMRAELRKPLGRVVEESAIDSYRHPASTFLGSRPAAPIAQKTVPMPPSVSADFKNVPTADSPGTISQENLPHERSSSQTSVSKNQKFPLPKSKIPTSHFAPQLITVGDISTKRLIGEGIKPDLAVFDLKVQRKRVFREIGEIGISREEYRVVKIKNSAGEVGKELFEYFSRTYRAYGTDRTNIARRGIFVEGEEDLAVLPAVLFAPLGAIVVYGQPKTSSKLKALAQRTIDLWPKSSKVEIENIGSGLVVVEVTEEKKEKVFNLLSRFVK